MKTCCACGETKELKMFYRNKAVPGGYFQRCKRCMNDKKLCRQGRPTGMKYQVEGRRQVRYDNSSWQEIRLQNPTKKDYIETYEFLKKIGYKLDESIHEQFCEKFDLEPTEERVFKSRLSPKDVGMA